jgi:hypothetical protein
MEFASAVIHPILVFSCRVRRKIWYFLWNIIFIVVSARARHCTHNHTFSTLSPPVKPVM